MKTVRFSYFLLFVAAAFLFGACEDATNVGQDLLGEQGGNPVTDRVEVTDVGPAALVRTSNLAPRVLAGMVDDPSLGKYVVDGYFDVTAVTSSDFRAGTVENVELRFIPAYVYGDSTSEVTLALREITEDWEADGLPTDTSFSVGPVLKEFTFLANDTLVIVPLPEDWVEENDAMIRSEDFGAQFHGFRLDPVSGNAVVGLGPSGSGLFAATADDSTFSPFARSYPRARRTMPVNLPPDRLLMQAGVGPIVSFDLNVDSPSSSVNRASITLSTDTVSVDQNTPQHFVRPRLRILDLFGIVDDDTAIALGRATLNDDGQFVFDTPTIADALQGVILGSREFERFEVRIPNPTTLQIDEGGSRFYFTSLNPALFYDSGAADKAPAAFITRTPLE